MSSSMNPPGRDQPGTYVRQSRFTEEELVLLQDEERLMTAVMGGVLPEQSDPESFESILDVGCGTGQWLIELAKTYPTAIHLIGVDINTKIIAYAQAQAVTQQVADRVQFRVMDALGFLDFPADSFDLVNQRLGGSFLRTWEWSRLLHEFRRIARSGGVIRLVEGDMIESNSPTMMQRRDFVLQAFYRSGHSFHPQGDGLTSELASLLRQQGFQNVQTHVHILHYNQSTIEEQFFSIYLKRVSRLVQLFAQKWNRSSDDEMMHQQILDDVQKPDFSATQRLLTAWGSNPAKE